MQDRHVIVTGGAGGLGGPVVDALLGAGAHVHVPCFEDEVPQSLAARACDRLSCTTGVNLTDEASVAAVYAGRPSLWASVHLAGGFAMAPIGDTSAADFRRQLELNLTTAFLCCREAVGRMSDGGRIVNVAARPAVSPVGGMVAYSVAKAGVAALTRALAEEVRDRGIWVNAILPSIIDTPANRKAMPDADHDRWPKPAELAATIRFLASPDNALTSGALVPVYGRA